MVSRTFPYVTEIASGLLGRRLKNFTFECSSLIPVYCYVAKRIKLSGSIEKGAKQMLETILNQPN